MKFVLNGKGARVDAHPMKRLLDVLREDCALIGTKEGCGEGECGACTVLVDGLPVNSCLVPLVHASGARITTIEGIGDRHPLQRAFVELGGAQCGICTPGMIMASIALGPKPSLKRMRTGLAGNLCRCTGYSAIYRSVRRAGQTRSSGRGDSLEPLRSANALSKKRRGWGPRRSEKGGAPARSKR
jgi:carbon-monoxide dehydrogenase small subunit